MLRSEFFFAIFSLPKFASICKNFFFQFDTKQQQFWKIHCKTSQSAYHKATAVLSESFFIFLVLILSVYHAYKYFSPETSKVQIFLVKTGSFFEIFFINRGFLPIVLLVQIFLIINADFVSVVGIHQHCSCSFSQDCQQPLGSHWYAVLHSHIVFHITWARERER